MTIFLITIILFIVIALLFRLSSISDSLNSIEQDLNRHNKEILLLKERLLSAQAQGVKEAAQPAAPIKEESKEPAQDIPFEELLEAQKNRAMGAAIPSVKRAAQKEDAAAQPAFVENTQEDDDDEDEGEGISTAKLFSRVGAFALLLGVLFAFKYYSQNIPAEVRVFAGLLFGVTLLFLGLKRDDKELKHTAASLCSCGIAVIYGSFYAAFAFYNLIPLSLAFVLMALTAMGAFVVSAKKNISFIGILSIVIAFLTPILLKTGNNQYLFFFSYIALINIASFVVGVKKNWTSLIITSLVFTYLGQLTGIDTTIDKCAPFVIYVLGAALICARFSANLSAVSKAFLRWFIAGQMFFVMVFFAKNDVSGYSHHAAFVFALLLQIISVVLLSFDKKLYRSIFSFIRISLFALLAAYLSVGLHGANVFIDMWYLLPTVLVGLIGDYMLQKDGDVPTLGSVFYSLLPLLFLPIYVFSFVRIGSIAFWPLIYFLIIVPFLFGIMVILFKGKKDKALIYCTLILTAIFLLFIPFDKFFFAPFAPLFFAVIFIYGIIVFVRAASEELPIRHTALLGSSSILMPYVVIALIVGLGGPSDPVLTVPYFFVLSGALSLLAVAFSIFSKNGDILLFAVFGMFIAASNYYGWNFHAASGNLDVTTSLLPAAAGLTVKLLAITFGSFLLIPFVFKKRFEDCTGAWSAAALAGVFAFVIIYPILTTVFVISAPAAIALIFAGIYLSAVLVAVFMWPQVEQGIQAHRIATLGGATVFFITAAFALWLQNQWLTIALALQATALISLNRFLKQDWLNYIGIGLFCAVFARLIFNPAIFEYQEAAGTIVNWYLYVYLLVAAACFAAAKLWISKEESTPKDLLNSFGLILIFALGHIEIANYYAASGQLEFNIFGSFAETVTYTLAWAFFGVGYLALGIFNRRKVLTVVGIVLISIATIKVFGFDLWSLGALYRIFGLFGIAGVLIFAGMMLERFKSIIEGFEN